MKKTDNIVLKYSIAIGTTILYIAYPVWMVITIRHDNFAFGIRVLVTAFFVFICTGYIMRNEKIRKQKKLEIENVF
ncbi:MAG: hypothetical protein FWD68_15890 [Alphaproteobacteria bacterium]|nr:hypothetical protein [Alphaproteobacteria bacterium]